MKRLVAGVVGVAFLLVFAGVVLAQQNPVGDQGGQRSAAQFMMRAFGGIQQVIPLPDGSIIVVTGSRLMKYDKDLNLLKEVTVPRDAGLDAAAGGFQGRRGGGN